MGTIWEARREAVAVEQGLAGDGGEGLGVPQALLVACREAEQGHGMLVLID